MANGHGIDKIVQRMALGPVNLVQATSTMGQGPDYQKDDGEPDDASRHDSRPSRDGDSGFNG